MHEEEITTNMIDNMSQCISHMSELSHVDSVIKGKADGKAGGHPICEQPTVVQKKKDEEK